MLLRSILSRIHRNQRPANYSSLKNAGSSVSTPDSGPSIQNPPEKEYVISYLVSSCGLSPENAISASKRVHFDSPDKPNSVLNFLQKQGFTKTQIADLVKGRPKFLLSNPEKSLLPKIQFFSRFAGVSQNDVVAIVSRYPSLLTRSVENRLAPSYEYLKDIIGTKKMVSLFRRGSWSFGNFDPEIVIPNVDLLREIGVRSSFIEFSLSQYPEIVCLKHDEFRAVVEEVKQMGFDPLKSTFVLAIHARTGKGNLALYDRCYDVYSKWGWSRDDILMAFRKHPNCMICSEKKITRVLEFVVNELGRNARSVANCPNIIFFNMERRIVPRCSVVHILSTNGLVKKNWSLPTVLCPAEKVFLNRYVTRFKEELPELYDIYLSKKAEDVEA
ncbi:hypothetical protein PHJA_002477700 [Phtheirospermum japonicum]|uniref:Mitochondrial transcription termination factor n=1 Tax=Phtheirospermum japonicum TaxID=374723 RepID=A0A830D0I5_9LAMI|nr:hypothetical protein PHJA_002477700 [Phtheirospermum japonicum]